MGKRSQPDESAVAVAEPKATPPPAALIKPQLAPVEKTPRQLLDDFLAALGTHPRAKLLSTHYPGRPTNVQAIKTEPQFSQTLVSLKFVIAE